MTERVWRSFQEAISYYGSVEMAIKELNKACKDFNKKKLRGQNEKGDDGKWKTKNVKPASIAKN